jgi:hypothetical protein
VALLLVFALLPLAGCGGGAPALTPVQGQVRYKGAPLAGGLVVFAPDQERGTRGPLAHAEVGPDGRFTLMTDGKPGCVPGWHRVAVGGAGTRLPARYSAPELSGLHVEVKPGQPNGCELNLE